MIGQRFTPTCVGTTTRLYGWIACGPVHPHVRGDDCDGQVKLFALGGSPPRAWGRLRHAAISSIHVRFTPTCVGTTYYPCAYVEWNPVHPHVRGDDRAHVASYAALCGSPPRAWGRPRHSRLATEEFRFTPTCVGTT
mgnify:FL=1